MGRVLARVAAVAAGVAVLAGLAWGVASVTIRMQDSAGAPLGVAPIQAPGSTTAPTDAAPTEPTQTQEPAPIEPAPVQPAPAQPAPPSDDDDDDDVGELDDD